MDYAQVKQKANKVRKEISVLKRQKSALESELSSIAKERETASSNYQASYTKKSQDERTNYKNKLMQPIEQKLKELNEKQEQLAKQKEIELEETSEEKIIQNSSDKQSILQEVKESSDMLQQVIVETVGQRFSDELNLQLSKQELIVDKNQLDSIVSYFNLCADEISRFSSKSNKIQNTVRAFQKSILGVDVSGLGADNNIRIVIAIIFLVLTLLCFKYVYPFYVIVLIVVIVLNIIRNYKILKIILIHKAVRDNVSAIEDMIHKQALDLVEKKTKEINSRYEKESANLTVQIEQAKENLQKAVRMADSSFIFDDRDIRETYELAMKQKDSRENSINQEIHDIEVKVSNLFAKLETYEKQVSAFLGDLQHEYLDPKKIGTSYELNTKFLIDVEESKPVFFDYPMTSMLFLYDNSNSVQDFIRLINLQLRGKLNPTAFNIIICDVITIGKEYIRFKASDSSDAGDTYKRLFKILTTAEDFKEMVQEHTVELTSRMKDMGSDFKNIVEYNKFMLSIDSLTMPYIFIFIQDLDMAELVNSKTAQLLRNGGDFGIYFHVFLKKPSFIKGKDRAIEMCESIQKFYVLDEKGPKSRAKDWVLSLFDDS